MDLPAELQEIEQAQTRALTRSETPARHPADLIPQAVAYSADILVRLAK